jgi:hypothetical protein
MRRFNEATSWENARSSTLFTAAALAASERHEKAVKALNGQLDKWSTVESARRAAEDRLTRSHAWVAWSDLQLDSAVKAFANELLRDSKGDLKDKTFRAYFEEAPSEVIKLGLESESARAEQFFAVSEKVKISKGAATALAAVRKAIEAGKKALAERKAAFAAQASVSFDIAAWKEATDAARVSVHVQLQSWAVENGEDTGYADRFFPEPRGGAKKKKAGGEEGGKEGGTG